MESKDELRKKLDKAIPDTPPTPKGYPVVKPGLFEQSIQIGASQIVTGFIENQVANAVIDKTKKQKS
ncbi:MAG: hypothetical protein UR39_C0002G0030 [Candidatus Woesebacteria bacterium GW2011_GWA1_33_30]|uniref:Uncharacterized protein n=1 Tax=Candidatus Woesebacteria bacterium GW2011_GWA2_33_28 TaxID=1618561 RepID=A0A0G0CWX9_9BACT|nr:MAG: hypothetical protein UR38_C0002G0030 [Candidatus Woesebacteria bacterium GW2011_GWA2_33_28]KKP48740.1 MAG: hypothetical protein UR39_C0002G0030 [Candidatus Woesebacteria bacterium GW2011_GWA1_33_30]KKP50013.1 MAG: hypothetical protein UR40_C0002G0030 [Microgenomates group bacterium GW2011_GWC1_33_32]KKP51784.1 MAG: hypothetical protein UR44_C0006G0030 [Candidatus Woesebacteria bacterium GW2011_GWB1_33_38]KKP58602.1 MAG: hypothetical protein UR48_C0003G0029 [Microgenomates group bacteriu